MPQVTIKNDNNNDSENICYNDNDKYDYINNNDHDNIDNVK